MKTFWIIVVIIILIIVGAWWYSSNNTSTTNINLGLNSTSTNETVTGTPVLALASSTDLGNYLVAANGMTLYLYTKDKTGTTTCYGDCAVKWPPYIVSNASDLTAADGINGDLSTVTRVDGTGQQLTYKGIPLYFWQNDQKPGDTTGQNVGKVWFVVKP
jgi:predicted lipoprotein with Yx(FWY)xxD motif